MANKQPVLSAAERRALSALETPGAGRYAYKEWGAVLWKIVDKNDYLCGKVQYATLVSLEDKGYVAWKNGTTHSQTFVITDAGRERIAPK